MAVLVTSKNEDAGVATRLYVAFSDAKGQILP